MTLADSAIIGIIALLVMCIPGVRYLSRIIRRKLRSRQKQASNNYTVLPLSDYLRPLSDPLGGASMYPSPTPPTLIGTFGMTRQATNVGASENPFVPNFTSFVAVSMSATMVWPAVDLPPRGSGRSISRTG
ncbi:hypothetical protein NUW58_g5017 [Xylaria curta]|uniref:Uncharacterized protein n=1 Tax=Xylaria curta TaxID=42375 RepID=A0ACC1P6F4_9PEZI|nr:hypothetical protein NUW58_g5017 [Xylaria curta]